MNGLPRIDCGMAFRTCSLSIVSSKSSVTSSGSSGSSVRVFFVASLTMLEISSDAAISCILYAPPGSAPASSGLSSSVLT